MLSQLIHRVEGIGTIHLFFYCHNFITAAFPTSLFQGAGSNCAFFCSFALVALSSNLNSFVNIQGWGKKEKITFQPLIVCLTLPVFVSSKPGKIAALFNIPNVMPVQFQLNQEAQFQPFKPFRFLWQLALA